MDKKSKFPERRSVSSPDHCFRSGPQFFSAAYIVKTRPRLLDHQRAEHAVKLMCICKQMIMEKYSPQFFIRKKAFHQSFIFSGSRSGPELERSCLQILRKQIRFKPPLVVVKIEHMGFLDPAVDQTDLRRIPHIGPEDRRCRVSIYP